ncbi:hypothetical protein PsorP6_015183 [Peronosclerospora sorghi]|uniref:Uncharacterized protein n=1 Tax=Peronosclerospora sorghi TaxID=230839 RepID=A0ACC0VST3_9STRA|nr:hypothetical protein PsorP6_015183 [Peronosclerospora sorghi]
MDNVEKNHQRDGDDDDDCEITPGYNADIQEASGMEIDSVGRQQDYQGPSSQLTHSDIGTNRTDPLFEIDDIFINEEIDAEDWNLSQALHPTSSSSFSNAIVPVQDLLNEYTTEEKGRVSKRLRIGHEQACTAYEIPTSYDDALKSPQETMWRKATQVELDALNEKDTWSVEQMKPIKKIIGTKCFFSSSETSVVKWNVSRFVLLHWDIVLCETENVTLLLYCCVSLVVTPTLACTSDACIFIKQVNKSWVYVTLYVDDLLIGAKTLEVIQDIAAEIGKNSISKYLEACVL